MTGEIVRWRQPNGEPVTCDDKLKILNENIEEIRQICQDAFEDGLLIGCDEQQLREVLAATIADLQNPYGKRPP